MYSDNPPTPKYLFDIALTKYPDAGDVCERYACNEVAAMKVQVYDESIPYSSGWWVVVCKQHYDSVLDDEIEAAEDYEPDWEDDL